MYLQFIFENTVKIAKTIAVTDAQLSSEAINWYTSSNNTVGYKIGIFKERLLFEERRLWAQSYKRYNCRAKEIKKERKRKCNFLDGKSFSAINFWPQWDFGWVICSSTDAVRYPLCIFLCNREFFKEKIFFFLVKVKLGLFVTLIRKANFGVLKSWL